MSHYIKHIFICTHQKAPGKTCCANDGGEPFVEYMKKRLKKEGMHGAGKIRVSRSGCLGRCKLGPCMVIYPEGTWYSYKTFSDVDEIIQQHLIAGHSVPELLIDMP